MKKYEKIYQLLHNHIHQGIYQIGDKIPSVRETSKHYGYSLTTVMNAYQLLLSQGLISSYPKSGYFVSQNLSNEKLYLDVKQISPSKVTYSQYMTNIVNKVYGNQYIDFASAIPAPWIRQHYLKKMTIRYLNSNSAIDDIQKKKYLLITEIVKQLQNGLSHIKNDEVLLTSGCTSSVLYSLKALSNKEDIIAIESPYYYGIIQRLQKMQRNVIEIPSSSGGIRLDKLQQALQNWNIKCLIIQPAFSNPLGANLSDENKQRLCDIAKQHKMIIIESDIYADTGFTGHSKNMHDRSNIRPRTIHSFSNYQDQPVILCSSLSKTLDENLRLGWIVAGKYKDKIANELFTYQDKPSSMAIELALKFYQSNPKNYLKKFNFYNELSKNKMLEIIHKHFPSSVKYHQPQGNFNLWLQIENANVKKIFDAALKENILFMPGILFSSAQNYQDSLRLTYSNFYNEFNEKSNVIKREKLITLGKIIHQFSD